MKRLLMVFFAIGLFLAYYGYSLLYAGNTKFSDEEISVNIKSGTTFDEVVKKITPYVDNIRNFKTVANYKKYSRNIKFGHFVIKKGSNNNEIIRSLRNSVPVKLAFNNQERLENFAGRIGTQIEADSLSLLKSFKDSKFLSENGFNEDNVLSMFVPNSYEVFWNLDADKFRDRMLKEYRNFWTAERIEKAKKQNLTPIQVSILASIVHKETVKKDERPKVAGVYLNRLHKGIKLEADPTVIYAVKKTSGNFDQIIKRVLNKDLAVNSPYNTYKNMGLPPGPIAMPDITALEAVLNPAQHDYIFFCASVTNFGYHEFASTAAQHHVNSQKYHAWVDAQGIKR